MRRSASANCRMHCLRWNSWYFSNLIATMLYIHLQAGEPGRVAASFEAVRSAVYWLGGCEEIVASVLGSVYAADLFTTLSAGQVLAAELVPASINHKPYVPCVG